MPFRYLLCAWLVLFADVYVDGVKMPDVKRIDINTQVPPIQKLYPGSLPSWPLLEERTAYGNEDEVGFDEYPIARWHNPCFEKFETNKVIGIVAFHISGITYGDEGISHIEYIANNGTPTVITEPTKHPTLGYWAWWCDLQPINKHDGQVEIRAIVYPHVGKPRILQGGFLPELAKQKILPKSDQSLLLWSNRNETYSQSPRYVSQTGSDTFGLGTETAPYQTVAKAAESFPTCDHATIYVDAGIYQTPTTTPAKNSSGWLTICPKPTVKREDVVFTEPNGVNASQLFLIRLQDVCLRSDLDAPPLFKGRSIYLKLHLWLEGCDIRGHGPDANVKNSGIPVGTSSIASYYNTRSDKNVSIWANYSAGPRGQIVYGINIFNLSGDIFTGNAFTRDFNIVNHIKLDGQHPDLWQGFGGTTNRIMLDGSIEETNCQVYFFDDGIDKNTDVAMVNVKVNFNGGVSASQFGQNMRNLIIWNCENNQRLLNKDSPDGSIFQNISFANNIFSRMQHTKRTRTFQEIFALGGLYCKGNLFTSEPFFPEVGSPLPAEVSRIVRWDAKQNKRKPKTFQGAF